MDDLALDTRQRLPDALRILLQDYPREAWEADPRFDGLVRFWLDRHLMFRRLLEVLEREAAETLDGQMEPQRLAAGIGHYGGALVNNLHGHHQIEDAHYFPVLSRMDPRITRAFEILDADHHALDGHLNAFAEAANGAIRGLPGAADPKSVAEGYRRDLAGLARLLDRHLIDEEEIVVPVVLAHGTGGLG